ncbi:hypothetical protein HC928_22830 [bacterium]|nr:hypothetical protein [bacterium]
MQANPTFLRNDPVFWAHIRTISEKIGYTYRRTHPYAGQIRSYSASELVDAMQTMGLQTTHLVGSSAQPTPMATIIAAYTEHRASLLNNVVADYLMHAEQARTLYTQIVQHYPVHRLPVMNRQTGAKKQPMYLTGIVNALIEYHVHGRPCDYDPKRLPTFTRAGIPIRTLSRRVDGCFPACVNPIALWEIKEYYHTTTFGSRIADGIYETLLDGMELAELHAREGVRVDHLLVVDSDQWWLKGKSYLCRIIDLLHMGYVQEVLFGSEVVERLPVIVQAWCEQFDRAAPEQIP